MIPGEIMPIPGDIELNAGRATVQLTVANTGDRPIQVGSHYHFFETNPALQSPAPQCASSRARHARSISSRSPASARSMASGRT